jgi:ribonuclease P protein component
VAGDEGVNVAYAISRKVGSAVVRNRLRRRLRAAFDEMRILPHQGLYLVKCDNQAKDLSYDQLRNHLIEALGRTGVL